jgi:hypothetical protein
MVILTLGLVILIITANKEVEEGLGQGPGDGPWLTQQDVDCLSCCSTPSSGVSNVNGLNYRAG